MDKNQYADLVKGKGLVLITGKKGSGKSHLATKIISSIRAIYPDHPVYSNITGLKIDGVLPAPADWHDAPNNCTIFYDEVQLESWADNSNTKINSDARVKDMTLIRKQNKNIVLMTQDPMFIHSALRRLVDYHYHLSHPFKDGKPKVFYFHGAHSDIDDKGSYKTHAMETFMYELDKETSSLYQSIDETAVHDQKKKIPKKIIYGIIGIILLILVGIPLFIFGAKIVGGFIWGKKDNNPNKTQSTTSAVEPVGNAVNTVANGVNASVPVDYQTQQLIEQRKLYEKYLPKYTVEVANDDAVRPQGFIMVGGHCTAYNMFGDGLMIEQSECIKMLNNPALRPHPRYNKDQQNQQNLKYGQMQNDYFSTSIDDTLKDVTKPVTLDTANNGSNIGIKDVPKNNEVLSR